MAKPVILNKNKCEIDPSCKVLKSDHYMIYLEARDIIKEAKKQASDIVDKSKEIYQKEKERGYQDGLDSSKDEQAEQMLTVVSRTINYLSDVEYTLADILLSGVKKIISDFDQEHLTTNLVINALQHVRNEKQVTIRVPPSQHNMVKSKLNDILSDYKGIGFVDLLADPRLSTGDCIMESEIGIVDASVDVQMKALHKHFAKLKPPTLSENDGSLDVL